MKINHEMKVLWQKKKKIRLQRKWSFYARHKVIHDNPDNVLADVQLSVSVQFNSRKNAD